MNKTILFFATIVAFSALSFSFIKKPALQISNDTKTESPTTAKVVNAFAHDHAMEVENMSSADYDKLKLNKKGLSKNVMNTAVKGYLTLKENSQLKNTDLLTIVDFSQSSRKKRFYLLDMEKGELVENTFVAHAKNSGIDMAREFSNVIGSEKTSLGFYVTKGTYTGKHGLSLRLSGLEKGFNDNAEARAIVVHGAEYVNAGRVQSSYMGRSQGCPALPRENNLQVINLIKDGAAFFVYYPAKNYLQNSKLLNS